MTGGLKYAVALGLCLVAFVVAPDALGVEEGEFQIERSAQSAEIIDQGGRLADAIERSLQRIHLPAGFHISLYAIAPGARHMAVAPNTGIVFVGSRGSDFWALIDRDGDGRADRVERFAPTIALRVPNGGCFSKAGDLYLPELNRVLVFPGAEHFFDAQSYQGRILVPEGELIPVSEESRGHGARVCDVGPDGKLYIALGQPYNVSPPDKIALYEKAGIGGILRMNLDGSGREVFATGIRNSVGMDFNPTTGELWFTDNQVDGMGDEVPPGEINRASAPGQNYGFPWYGGGTTRTLEYMSSTPPQNLVAPAVEMVAHAADLGMTFYTGAMFPPAFRGGIFSAQHGSWDRSIPVGARVMFTPIGKDGAPGKPFAFAEGWLVKASGEYWGRPVDVAQLADGSILVSDDRLGAIYRIWYDGP
jgi:glucose/arabinose dehydrogenase